MVTPGPVYTGISCVKHELLEANVRIHSHTRGRIKRSILFTELHHYFNFSNVINVFLHYTKNRVRSDWILSVQTSGLGHVYLRSIYGRFTALGNCGQSCCQCTHCH